MKKLIIYVILLLLFGFANSFAQITKMAASQPSRDAGSHLDQGVLTEEQALQIKAEDFNPAKIDEATLVDPKMEALDIPEEEAYGPGNAKPSYGQDDLAGNDREEIHPPQLNVSAVKAEGTQPQGDQAGDIINYRALTESGNSQPAGENVGTVPNYREMNGPKEQPPGDKPDK